MKKLVIVFSLLCLFLLGGVCGFAVAVRMARNSLNEEHVVNQRMAEETRRLKLTPQQLDKAIPSYQQFKQDLVTVKQDTLQAIARVAVMQSLELSKLLTADQLEEFKKLSDERRIKYEKMMKP
jgi:aspartate oxidase